MTRHTLAGSPSRGPVTPPPAARHRGRGAVARAGRRRQHGDLLGLRSPPARAACPCRRRSGSSTSRRRGREPGNVSTSDAGDVQYGLHLPAVPRPRAHPDVVHGDRRLPSRSPPTWPSTARRSAREGLLVSGGYFPALQLRPALGRLLTPDDDRDGGGSDVVVLSHRYWITRFAANPAVLNDTLVVNNVPMTIVGVAPPGVLRHDDDWRTSGSSFRCGSRRASRAGATRTSRRDWWIYVTARLKARAVDGAGRGADRPALLGASCARSISRRSRTGLSEQRARRPYSARTVVLEPGSQGHIGNREARRPSSVLLFAVTAFVLLIACANVANLLMARATERRRRGVGAAGGRRVGLGRVPAAVRRVARCWRCWAAPARCRRPR